MLVYCLYPAKACATTAVRCELPRAQLVPPTVLGERCLTHDVTKTSASPRLARIRNSAGAAVTALHCSAVWTEQLTEPDGDGGSGSSTTTLDASARPVCNPSAGNGGAVDCIAPVDELEASNCLTGFCLQI